MQQAVVSSAVAPGYEVLGDAGHILEQRVHAGWSVCDRPGTSAIQLIQLACWHRASHQQHQLKLGPAKSVA